MLIKEGFARFGYLTELIYQKMKSEQYMGLVIIYRMLEMWRDESNSRRT